MNLLSPPPFRPEITGPAADARYRRLRAQVFTGAFIGYAAFYLVRKNFAMAIPMLEQLGMDKGELGLALGMNAVAYALSKFLMGSVSDRSDARKFLPLGLVLSAIAMACMAVPVTWLDLVNHPERRTLAVALMGALNFLVGWFGGMGWPPCGRVMTHWFSQNERGTMMAIWNCAHNVGGGLIGPMASYGAVWFGSWLYGTHSEFYFLAGTFIFPAATVIPIALLAYILLRDTPQSQGLPAVEKWRNDFPQHYNAQSEAVLSIRDIMLRHVLPNKCLWAIALSNAFIYMVRYGCLDWAPALLSDQGVDIKSAGWAYFAYEYAAIPGTLICGIISDRLFKGNRAWPTMLACGTLHRHLLVCLFARNAQHQSGYAQSHGHRILHLRPCDAGGRAGARPCAQECCGYGSRTDRLLRLFLRYCHPGQYRHRLHLESCRMDLDIRIASGCLRTLHPAHAAHAGAQEAVMAEGQ